MHSAMYVLCSISRIPMSEQKPCSSAAKFPFSYYFACGLASKPAPETAPPDGDKRSSLQLH